MRRKFIVGSLSMPVMAQRLAQLLLDHHPECKHPVGKEELGCPRCEGALVRRRLTSDDSAGWLNLYLAFCGAGSSATMLQYSQSQNFPQDDGMKFALALARIIEHCWEIASEHDQQRAKPDELSLVNQIQFYWSAEADKVGCYCPRCGYNAKPHPYCERCGCDGIADVGNVIGVMRRVVMSDDLVSDSGDHEGLAAKVEDVDFLRSWLREYGHAD